MGDTNPAAKPGTGEGAPAPGGPGDEKRFTQEEVNRIVGQRVRDVEAKFADYPALKKSADELANLKHTQMTAEEKLREELMASKALVAERGTQMAALAIRAEVRTVAMQKGIVDPDAAYALVDHKAIRYNEDGTVAGVSEALDELMVRKPYLKAQAHAANLNPGGGQPAPLPARLTDQQKIAAKAMGIDEEKYAKGIRTRTS